MKTNLIFDTNTYLRLTLMVPAIALMGVTGCSSAGPGLEPHFRVLFSAIFHGVSLGNFHQGRNLWK
jgi:hypothetical protein